MSRMPEKLNQMTFIPVRQRFIYSIANQSIEEQRFPGMEVIFRIDTYNLKQGWACTAVKCSYDDQGCQYGYLPLADYRGWPDESSFLVFGGWKCLSKLKRRTAVYKFDNQSIENSSIATIGKLKENCTLK